jgi:hypothetical protein
LKERIKPCLEEHFFDKVKSGTAVVAEAWFASAERHLSSARTIISADPSGALLLSWQAMHDLAKGLTALANCRLEGESHGKVVDFLVCVYEALSDRDKGTIRRASTGRNALSYDNPASPDVVFCEAAVVLAERLLTAARSGTLPAVQRKVPPPPERV